MSVKPFPFERLSKVSRREGELLQIVYQVFPRVGISEQLLAGFEGALAGHLALDVTIRPGTVETVNVNEALQRVVGAQSLVALLSSGPAPGRILVEIDSVIALTSVDQLLSGGVTEGAKDLFRRSPGEKTTGIDQGILSYLLLKLLEFVYEKTGKQGQLHFRLEGLAQGLSEFKPHFKGDEPAVLFSYSVTMGERNGFVRLLLPESAIQSIAKGVSVMQDEELLMKRVESLGFIRAELQARVGRTSLKMSETVRLEKGDIVLFDETEAALTPEKKLSGVVTLLAGEGRRLAMPATVLEGPVGGRRLTVRLESILAVHE